MPRWRHLLVPRSPMFAVLRIALLVGLGWLGLQWWQTGAAQWDTDFSRAVVPLSEIRSGGPPKDGIPAIDAPRFIDVDEARPWLDAREPVIVVSLDGQARAYPLQIMIWHEIVNDRLAGQPIAVTFCPLCNAALVFDRRLDERVLDFGTTGKLRKQDLVMYDRQTETWWQQFTGRGLVGRYAGRELTELPARIVAFRRFAAAHPHGEVLSRRTGYDRPYGRNPYPGYDSMAANPLNPRGAARRLPAKARVLGVRAGGERKLYPLQRVARKGAVNDRVGGVPVVVIARGERLSALDAERIAESRTVPEAAAYRRQVAGEVRHFALREGHLIDRGTGSRWSLLGRARTGPLAGQRLEPVPGGLHYAFAWLAFHPDTAVYREAQQQDDAAGSPASKGNATPQPSKMP